MSSTRRVEFAGGTGEVSVAVPGSKSVANRALVCAALADGVSTLHNVPDGDDCVAMVDALGAVNDAGTVHVGGTEIGGQIWDAALAGTTSRFLTAMAALGESPTVVDGGVPLRNRPMADLHDALRELGATVEPLGEHGHLPVSVSRGSIRGGVVSVRGDVSSQFISALMMIGPCLAEGLEIHFVGDLVSRPYVEMTARVMEDFGAKVSLSKDSISIPAGKYVSRTYNIEPDFSSAAFPLCAIAVGGGTVRIPQLLMSMSQADSEILDILTSMGVAISVDGMDVLASRQLSTDLHPLTRDMSQCSDLVPAVVVTCVFASGVSELSGIGFIRRKESDRLGDVATELNALGAKVEVLEDGLRIHGGVPTTAGIMGTHHDHRLAMAFALLGTRLSGIRIADSGVVSKSWPTYWSDISPIVVSHLV
jgi:3-phosphoshikimate 1-carboxyvinyltransferase